MSFFQICRVLLLFISCAAATNLYADQGIKAQLGEDSVRFMYLTEAWGQNVGKLDVEGGLMFTDRSENMASLAVLVRNESLDTPITLALGARVYYVEIGNKAIGGLAFGGEANLKPFNWKGIGVGVHYFVAPSITSFLDGDGVTEFGININYQLTPTVNIYAGYQNVDVGIANASNVTIADGTVIGVNVSF